MTDEINLPRKTDDEILVQALTQRSFNNDIKKLSSNDVTYLLHLAAQNPADDPLNQIWQDNLEKFFQLLHRENASRDLFKNNVTTQFLFKVFRNTEFVKLLKNDFLVHLNSQIFELVELDISTIKIVLDIASDRQSIADFILYYKLKALDSQSITTAIEKKYNIFEYFPQLQKSLFDIQDQKEKLDSKLQKKEQELVTLRQGLDNKEKEYELSIEKTSVIEAHLERAQNQILSLANQIQKLKMEKEELETNINQLKSEDNKSLKKNEKREFDEKIRKLISDINNLQREKDYYQNLYEKNKTPDINDGHTTALLQQAIATLKLKSEDLQRKLDEKNEKIKNHDREFNLYTNLYLLLGLVLGFVIAIAIILSGSARWIIPALF